ncbi:hypothetical protein NDU88_006166, partial [Pleurodeles waltl]
ISYQHRPPPPLQLTSPRRPGYEELPRCQVLPRELCCRLFSLFSNQLARAPWVSGNQKNIEYCIGACAKQTSEDTGAGEAGHPLLGLQSFDATTLPVR